jgi:hypothetical protein
VVAAFDGGAIASDAGALLLGATDRAIGLMSRFAGCFHARAARPRRRAADRSDKTRGVEGKCSYSALRARELCGGKSHGPSLWGLPDRMLHCGISVASAARFMAEMGHDPKFSY